MSYQPEGTTTRWGKAHAWWQTLPDVDLDRWGVLTTLSLYADDNGLCHPSQATIARALKRSRPWVNRVISDLTEVGLLHKTARTRSTNAGTTSCEYRIVTDPAQLQRSGGRVTNPTPVCHEEDRPRHFDDTPCHDGDTNQLGTEQINTARLTRDPSEHPNPPKQIKTGPVPADWMPSAVTIQTARSLSPDEDLTAHAIMFLSRSRAKDYRYAEDRIDEAWLAWLAEDRLKEHRKERVRDDRHHQTSMESPRDAEERRFAVWAAAVPAPKVRVSTPARSEAENPWR